MVKQAKSSQTPICARSQLTALMVQENQSVVQMVSGRLTLEWQPLVNVFLAKEASFANLQQCELMRLHLLVGLLSKPFIQVTHYLIFRLALVQGLFSSAHTTGIVNLATSAKKAPRLLLLLMNRRTTGTNVRRAISANLVSWSKNLVNLVSTILVWLRVVA